MALNEREPGEVLQLVATVGPQGARACWKTVAVLKTVAAVELQVGWAHEEEVEEQKRVAEEELQVEKKPPTSVVEARVQMAFVIYLVVEVLLRSVVVEELVVEVPS